MCDSFQIAIDGPVAAGKGTVSRLLAQKLDFLYVDTGAMYRIAALVALRNHLPFEDENKIIELLEKSDFELRNPSSPKEMDGRSTTVILDGEDVSWEIRTQKCDEGSSRASTMPKLRAYFVKKQQEIAECNDVVMEGRDTTFRVLPNADLKIFLTASLEARVDRRHKQQLIKGIDISESQVSEEIEKRDNRDSNRETDPLHVVEDAWVIDTSDLEIEEVVDLIVERVKEIKNKK